MKMHLGKTKVMVISRAGERCSVTINGERIEEVQSLKYLGSSVSADGGCDEHIEQRIGAATRVIGATIVCELLTCTQQIANKPSQRLETPTIECPREGDVCKYSSAEEPAAKNQKTTVCHFGFTEKYTDVCVRQRRQC